jgi:hypothetical protein
MFLELKAEKGQLAPEQVDWLSALSGVDQGLVTSWRGRDTVPDGAAFHVRSGWTTVAEAGDWMILVAGPVRPRHWDWCKEMLDAR